MRDLEARFAIEDLDIAVARSLQTQFKVNKKLVEQVKRQQEYTRDLTQMFEKLVGVVASLQSKVDELNRVLYLIEDEDVGQAPEPENFE